MTRSRRIDPPVSRVVTRPEFTDNLWHILAFLKPEAICTIRSVCRAWKTLVDATSRESEHWLALIDALRPLESLTPANAVQILTFSRLVRWEPLTERCLGMLVFEFGLGARPAAARRWPGCSATALPTPPPPATATAPPRPAPLAARPAGARTPPPTPTHHANVSRAVAASCSRFGELEPEVLAGVLCRDDLVTSDELSLVEAIAKWAFSAPRCPLPSAPAAGRA